MRRLLRVLVVLALCVVIPLAVRQARGAATSAVEVTRAALRAINPTILATGTLVYAEEVQLSSEVIGRVAAILVAETAHVRKGQPVLRLERTSYDAAVAQQVANVKGAEIAVERTQLNVGIERRNAERVRQLAASHFVGSSKADEAEHVLELAQVDQRVARESLSHARALLAEATDRLSKTEIRAPIDGTVTALTIKVGETAVVSATSIAGSSLMTIANVDSLIAEVNIDEADIARVAVGASVKVFPATQTGAPFIGTVASVAMVPKSVVGARNYVIKVRLPRHAQGILAGMTCRAEVNIRENAPTMSLPIQAVLSARDGDGDGSAARRSYVYVLDKGVAARRDVVTGNADDVYVEIRQGLGASDEVAVGPAHLLHALHSGQRLVALPPPEAARKAAH